jgi:hypothetical protein
MPSTSTIDDLGSLAAIDALQCIDVGLELVNRLDATEPDRPKPA